MATTELTENRVTAAYAALATGDRTTIEEYWDPEVTWLAAGESRVSGLHVGLDDFLGFMRDMGEVTGGTLRAEPRGVLLGADTAVLLTHNTATRADDPSRTLDIDEVHLLRFRAGKIVEGKGALFGHGTTEFSRFVG